MLQTLMCYAKVHIKNKIIRLNFILFIHFFGILHWFNCDFKIRNVYNPNKIW
jgi:hypothetical protein